MNIHEAVRQSKSIVRACVRARRAAVSVLLLAGGGGLCRLSAGSPTYVRDMSALPSCNLYH